MQMRPCPCCDVNMFENGADREHHVERCAVGLRKQYLALRPLAKMALENLEDDIENHAMRHSCGKLIAQLRTAIKV